MGMNGVEKKEVGNKRVLEAECLNAKISLEGEVGRRNVGTYLCGNELNNKGLWEEKAVDLGHRAAPEPNCPSQDASLCTLLHRGCKGPTFLGMQTLGLSSSQNQSCRMLKVEPDSFSLVGRYGGRSSGMVTFLPGCYHLGLDPGSLRGDCPLSTP